jgi:hypothetical protein
VGIETEVLLADFRRGVEYASRAGLLRDPDLLSRISTVGDHAVDSAETRQALITNVNSLASVIAPITYADLACGRDPFEAKNQAIARTMQFVLGIFALVVVVLLVYYNYAVHAEQSAIATLQGLQNVHPVDKVNALRKMIQWERALKPPPTTMFEEYHQRTSELRDLMEKIGRVSEEAGHAVELPLIPFVRYREAFPHTVPPPQLPPPPSGNAALALPVSSAAAADKVPDPPVPVDFCLVDETGNNVKLPAFASSYPAWMQDALLDTANDFCFQVRVLSDGTWGSTVKSYTMPLGFITVLQDKVALQIQWILPFLYGLLGSALFLMRYIRDVRTPVVDWLAVTMRLVLGGVSGIVIGWLANLPTMSGSSGANLSLPPLVLAFLSGYGIDALFNVLDRMNRAITLASAGKQGKD